MPKQAAPITYDPSKIVVHINGETFVNINSAEASPIEGEEWQSNRATTGARGWVRTPEWGGELTIEFSGNLPPGKRQSLRNLMDISHEVTVNDKSGTKDGVTLTDAKIVSEPDFSRDDSEATFDVTWQGIHAQWGG